MPERGEGLGGGAVIFGAAAAGVDEREPGVRARAHEVRRRGEPVARRLHEVKPGWERTHVVRRPISPRADPSGSVAGTCAASQARMARILVVDDEQIMGRAMSWELKGFDLNAKRVAGGGEAKLGLYSGSFDLRYKINGTPLVSIVIPSAGRMARVREKDIDLLAQAVSSIYEHTAYRNFEIIVVDNNDLRRDTLEALKPYGCRYVHFDGEFNIATKMNLGAREARGDYLLFMNDDIEVIAPDWLECMLQLCQRKGVGIVGAKLHFENEALQHVGVAFWNGLPDHIHREFPGTDPGHFFSAVANRNYLAVTGAVLLTKRELFEKVDGFDEQFAINYNDIDYCLRVFREGFRIVYAAGARLFHYESVSRERVVAPEEISLFQQKWLDTVSHDPYYSTFFDNHPPVFALRHEWPSPSTLDPIKSLVVSHR